METINTLEEPNLDTSEDDYSAEDISETEDSLNEYIYEDTLTNLEEDAQGLNYDDAGY